MPLDTTGDHQKTAVVTGGSRGLGRALVEALAVEGWRVVTDARAASALSSAVEEMGVGTVRAIAGDVADPAHRAELLAAVSREGGLDLLVNNASLLGPSPMPRLADYRLEDLRSVVEANAIAPLALMQDLSTWLTARGGRIVNITSDAGAAAYPGWGGYGSSKAALELLTGVWAAEHPALRVYAFDPGDMATEMHQAAFPGEDISDRPHPGTVVPALLALAEGDIESGRYSARELLEEVPA